MSYQYKNPHVEMENVANAYLNLLNQSEVDRLTSMERQEQETQIFWESENMQLERQKQMGIRETFELSPAKLSKKEIAAGIQDTEGRILPVKAGHVLVGKSERTVQARRYIYKDGKLIKTFKSDCESTVSVLKANVQNETEAICPSCGGLGTIASYIDGCDYCNSKFTVKDFHAKVTGFSLIENVQKMLTQMTAKVIRGYVILFLAVWALCFFSGFLTVFLHPSSLITPSDNPFIQLLLRVEDFAWTKGFATVFKAFFVMFVSITVFGIISRLQTAFSNTQLVSSIMPDFNEVEFRQDLEHRIKTAMMSPNPEAAMAYSQMDLTAFCEAHKDVFDMSIAKVKFTSAQFDPEHQNYVIGVDVTVKLYRMNKGRVKERYECLHMLVSQFKGIRNTQSTSILEYQCPNCAAGINIFHGCTCEYCGTQINKFLLGPVIQQCTWNGVFNMYRNLPIILIIVVAVILIL